MCGCDWCGSSLGSGRRQRAECEGAIAADRELSPSGDRRRRDGGCSGRECGRGGRRGRGSGGTPIFTVASASFFASRLLPPRPRRITSASLSDCCATMEPAPPAVTESFLRTWRQRKRRRTSAAGLEKPLADWSSSSSSSSRAMVCLSCATVDERRSGRRERPAGRTIGRPARCDCQRQRRVQLLRRWRRPTRAAARRPAAAMWEGRVGAEAADMMAAAGAALGAARCDCVCLRVRVRRRRRPAVPSRSTQRHTCARGLYRRGARCGTPLPLALALAPALSL